MQVAHKRNLKYVDRPMTRPGTGRRAPGLVGRGSISKRRGMPLWSWT